MLVSSVSVLRSEASQVDFTSMGVVCLWAGGKGKEEEPVL